MHMDTIEQKCRSTYGCYQVAYSIYRSKYESSETVMTWAYIIRKKNAEDATLLDSNGNFVVAIRDSYLYCYTYDGMR